MNRKILGIAVAILAVAMLASPVLAASGGQKVSASLITIGQPDPATIYTYGSTTPAGIMHYGGLLFYFNMLTIDQTTYPIYSFNYFDTVYNVKQGLLVYRCDATWFVTDEPSTSVQTENGFEGQVVYSIYLKDSTINVEATTHGFGDFEGQTLVLHYNGPISGYEWTGVCIKG